VPDVQPQTVSLPPLSVRAAISTSSIDVEKRTVEVVFSTGAPVKRFDWETGERYIEKLAMGPENIRLERINSGGPVLDSHSAYSLANQLGVVEDGSARVAGKKGTATLRFSRRPEVEPVWTDVQDRIVRNVSVGYIVHAYEETPGKNGAPKTRLATDWEPYEISMVPMPADIGAQTRGDKPAGELHPCQILTRGEEPPPQEQTTMEPQTPETPLVERDLLLPAPRLALDTPEEPNDRELGMRAERERNEALVFAARSVKLPSDQLDKMIKDGTSAVDGQRICLEWARKIAQDDRGPRVSAVADVQMGEDPHVHVRSGIQNALLHRIAPKSFALDDNGRRYRTMSILDTAEVFLKHYGKRTTSMTRTEIVREALEHRTGYHTTSDFGDILGNVIKATMRAAYGEEPQTFLPISQRVNASDFKQMRMLQLGDAPDLEKVLEHGEFTRGTIAESKEVMQLETYGRIFAITRQALVNDDLGAFSTIPAAFGRSARKKESDIVWGVITGNPLMGDGNALFSAAHSNLETDGDAISVASMSRARMAMRLQTNASGNRLNLVPRILIVPPSLETWAEQFLAPVLAAQTSTAQNPFAGKFQVIVEARLEDDSPTAWYLATDASQLPVIAYAYLDGQEGPSIETRSGFDIDGVETRARLDFDAAPVDWRGIHKDPGDEVS
jgi:hypothetical protein